MQIKKINLTNFRNYDQLSLEFSPTVNFIYGKNGSGKTNLIEAIYLLSLTKSFRINNDKLMIKKGSNATKVEGIIETKVKTSYLVEIDETGKKVSIDNNKKEKISDYISRINIILFNPDDSKILTSSPNDRRKLLNIEISQLYKEYLLLLSDYNKILKHRNTYLKELYLNGNSSKEYLDILTKKLIEIGLKINKYREEFIIEINKYIGKIYKDIFTEGELEVKYISSYNHKTEENLLNIYKKIYSKEMAFGKTLIGIHHDDLDFLLDKNKLKEWGSVGQLKNSIISFKLAELLIVKEVKKEYPILILDDLFSELDNEKIINLLNILDNYVQTFITITDIEKIDKNKFKNAKIFKVEKGQIKEENYE